MKYIFVILLVLGSTIKVNGQWQQLSYIYCAIIDLAVDGTNIYAGTSYDVGTSTGGVHLSTDSANTWNPVNSGLTLNLTHQVLSMATTAIHVFAATNNAGVFHSTNNGTSWSAVNNGLPSTNVASLAVSGTTIFAGIYDQGVFKSIDYGNSWTNTNCPLPFIRTIFTSGPNIYVGTIGSGVAISPNTGNVWSTISNGLPPGCDILSLTKAGSNLYAGTWDDGVLIYSGGIWTSTGTGPNFVTSMVSFGTNVMATSWLDGVYLTVDNGVSWTLENTGVANPSGWLVYTLDIMGSDIYAAEKSNSSVSAVYKRSTNDFTTNTTEIGIDEKLFNIYPNPINNGIFTINLQSNNISQKVQISICDMLGKNVYKDEFEGNSHQVKSNNLEDGIYLLKLTDGDKKSFKKIIIASK